MSININSLRAGDRLAIAKGAFITHYGIYSGNGMVIDNSNQMGRVHERSLQDFSGGKDIRVVPTTSKYTPQEIVARARAQIGKTYGWFSQNCEHFVNEIQHGSPRSTQALIGGAIIAFLVYKIISGK